MTQLTHTADRHTAAHRLETAFIPLPGIHQAAPLWVPEEALPEEQERIAMATYGEAFALIDVLRRVGVRDVTPDTPWRVGGFCCAWQSDAAGVSLGWRQLRLPGLSAYTYHDDTQAPRLHLSPDAGVIYEPGPHALDPEAPRWVAVQSFEQLWDLVTRLCPLQDGALEPPVGH